MEFDDYIFMMWSLDGIGEKVVFSIIFLFLLMALLFSVLSLSKHIRLLSVLDRLAYPSMFALNLLLLACLYWYVAIPAVFILNMIVCKNFPKEIKRIREEEKLGAYYGGTKASREKQKNHFKYFMGAEEKASYLASLGYQQKVRFSRYLIYTIILPIIIMAVLISLDIGYRFSPFV